MASILARDTSGGLVCFEQWPWQPRCTINVEFRWFLPLSVSSLNFSSEEECLMSQTNAKRQMPSRLVWIDEKGFRGFGCSECSWRFEPTGEPTGTSFDEMMRNFEL